MMLDCIEATLYLNTKWAEALAELCGRAGSGGFNFDFFSDPLALRGGIMELGEALKEATQRAKDGKHPSSNCDCSLLLEG